MNWKDFYHRYFLNPFRTDFRFWLGTSLVYALAFALSLLGVTTMLASPRVPSLDDLALVEGVLGVSGPARSPRITVESRTQTVLASCELRVCGPHVRDNWNVPGSKARAWSLDREIWQLEVEGRVVQSLEQRAATAERRRTEATWMVIVSIPLWLFAILRDWSRSRRRRPLS